jgi:hypothetical protein
LRKIPAPAQRPLLGGCRDFSPLLAELQLGPQHPTSFKQTPAPPTLARFQINNTYAEQPYQLTIPEPHTLTFTE